MDEEADLEYTGNHVSKSTQLVTQAEVENVIKTNLNTRKAPEIDWQYVPDACKVAKFIMIPKPGKPPNEVTSHRSIALLPNTFKLFEKLLLNTYKTGSIDTKQSIRSQTELKKKANTPSWKMKVKSGVL